MDLKLRPFYQGEKFVQEKCNVTVAESLYFLPKNKGWVVYDKNPYIGICVVVGVPGNWFIRYYHETKGVQQERIAVPRAARYRILQIIAENPKRSLDLQR